MNSALFVTRCPKACQMESEECMECRPSQLCLMCSGLPCPICVEADAYRRDAPKRIAEACLSLHEKIHADAHLAAVDLTKEANEPAEEYIDYYMFFYRKEYVKLYEKGKAEIAARDEVELEPAYNRILLKYYEASVCSYHQESVGWLRNCVCGEPLAFVDGERKTGINCSCP